MWSYPSYKYRFRRWRRLGCITHRLPCSSDPTFSSDDHSDAEGHDDAGSLELEKWGKVGEWGIFGRVFVIFCCSLSILISKNCYFWDLGPLQYRFKPFHWRVQEVFFRISWVKLSLKSRHFTQVALPKWLDGTSQSLSAIQVKIDFFVIDIAPQNNVISAATTQVYLAIPSL